MIAALKWFSTLYKVKTGISNIKTGIISANIMFFKFIFSSLKYPANAKINPIFDNSDGWKDIPIIFTHLPAPPEDCPIPGIFTKNSKATDAKYINQ